jgi:hypothetical protein
MENSIKDANQNQIINNNININSIEEKRESNEINLPSLYNNDRKIIDPKINLFLNNKNIIQKKHKFTSNILNK